MYAIAIQPDLGKNIYILNDKKLYYNIDECYVNDNDEIYCNFTNYNLSDSNDYSLELFDEIDNIKRIKSINYGTGLDYSIFAITEDGNVYIIRKNNEGELVFDEVNDDFAAYGVEDILFYEVSVPMGDTWKVILKDGTIMKKTIGMN